MSNCYWPGGGKEGQFLPNFGQQTRANATTSTTTTNYPLTPVLTNSMSSRQTDHFVLLAQASTISGQSGVLINVPPKYPQVALISKGFQELGKGKILTVLDSGVSDTMFISKEAFVEYKAIDSWVGGLARAKDGNFKIIGQGNVVQSYLINGKERKITYTCMLHTPTLNANLISISTLDRAGLTMFSNSKGITRNADGTTVLVEENVNEMYILETLDKPHHIPLALNSLSHTTSLEQWHQHLTHCSPSMIQEIANKNMVDGLKISDNNLNGKCKNCIMGHQTC